MKTKKKETHVSNKEDNKKVQSIKEIIGPCPLCRSTDIDFRLESHNINVYTAYDISRLDYKCQCDTCKYSWSVVVEFNYKVTNCYGVM